MQNAVYYFFIFIIIVLPILAIGFYVCWLKAKQRHLEALRKKLDMLQPVDPEYDQTKAEYLSAMDDIERWEWFG